MDLAACSVTLCDVKKRPKQIQISNIVLYSNLLAEFGYYGFEYEGITMLYVESSRRVKFDMGPSPSSIIPETEIGNPQVERS